MTSKKLFADETITEVKRTWSLINSDLQAVGVDVLLRLFEKYPSYQHLFNAFKDTPIGELKNKNEFLRHATAVAESLNRAVESLRNADTLVPLLIGLGQAHKKRKLTPAHFKNIEPVILESIQRALNTHCTEKVLAAWKETLSVAVSTIAKGAED